MSQAKDDQDATNEVVAALAKRFGPKRVVLALHAYALSRSNGQTPDSPWTKLAGELEEVEDLINTLELNWKFK